MPTPGLGLDVMVLLTDAQRREARDRLVGQFPDATALAVELRRRDWITDYQLEALLAGRGDELVLGAYHLLEPLGQGGMGEVFRARHALMNRVVAVKRIRPDVLARPLAAKRFRKEIELAARLSHPNVVIAHDAQEAGGRVFLVMEYCPGVNLRRVVEDAGPLPVGAACEYARQVARGLQHVHAHGLVHRDIKPENLLLVGGVVKILDLGLARVRLDAVAPSGSLTAEGAVLGTPDFLSPEQATDARSADIRSDLYSLGCTLYYLLTGQMPFPGGSVVEKVLRHQIEAPTPVERLRADVPPRLTEVVARLLKKNPADRYQTPAEVVAALKPWADTTVALRAPKADAAETVADESPGWRRRALTGLAVLATLGLLAAVAWVSWALFREETAARPTVETPPTAAPAPVARQPATAPTPPAKPAPQPTVGPRRWAFVEKHTPIVGEELFGVAASPDGRYLAVCAGSRDAPLTRGKQVFLFDRRAGKWAGLGEHRDAAFRVAFTPDSRTLVSVAGTEADIPRPRGDIALRDVTGATPPVVHHDAINGGGQAVGVDPNGRWVVVAGRDGNQGLVLVDLPSRKLRHTPKREFADIPTALAVSPDGRFVARGFRTGQVEVVETTDWTVTRAFWVPEAHITFVSGLAFRPDGRELVGAFGVPHGGKAVVKVWNVVEETTPNHVARLLLHGEVHIFASALAPDGRTLATGDQNGLIQLWDVAADPIAPLAELKGHEGSVRGLCFVPDGTLVSVSSDQTVRMWQKPPG